MMTAILESANGPCIQRTVQSRGHTFEIREWPVQIARHRSVIENRAPTWRTGLRDAGGRFRKGVLHG